MSQNGTPKPHQVNGKGNEIRGIETDKKKIKLNVSTYHFLTGKSKVIN